MTLAGPRVSVNVRVWGRVRLCTGPGYQSWFQKTRVTALAEGEMRIILRSLVLTQRVTDRHAACSYVAL